ncbi:MAG: hypothetical protein WC975_11985 [Phycisphaerae bacterium]
MITLVNKRISDLFVVKSGDFHATKELDLGATPLISCGDTSNGLVGYFDIPDSKIYRRAITVAYNGSWPLTAKFHPYKFGAKDDVAVLCPIAALENKTLFYIAAMLTRMTWRYSYGRKCFKEKLRYVQVPVPVRNVSGMEQIDEAAISRMFPKGIDAFIPKKVNVRTRTITPLKWKATNVLTVFDIDRGDFHAIDDLDSGSFMTVSRVTEDNGVVGYFDRPNDAKVYERGKLTVSTVCGDAFVQLDDFIATDNVIICSPKKKLRKSTLIFLAFVLNHQKWRYSYGRQCYLKKFARTEIFLPLNEKGDIDEDTIAAIVECTPYWPQIKMALTKEK